MFRLLLVMFNYRIWMHEKWRLKWDIYLSACRMIEHKIIYIYIPYISSHHYHHHLEGEAKILYRTAPNNTHMYVMKAYSSTGMLTHSTIQKITSHLAPCVIMLCMSAGGRKAGNNHSVKEGIYFHGRRTTSSTILLVGATNPSRRLSCCCPRNTTRYKLSN